MAIWQAETDSSYKSLAYDNERHARFLRLYERGELPSWSPVYVGYGTDVYPDFDPDQASVPSFPALSSSIACGRKVSTILAELVHGHVDFLPLASHAIKHEQYYILYTKTILHCLDNDETEFARMKSGYIKGVRRYVFKPDCIGATPIFRLPVAGSPIGEPYVNDAFKQLVEDNNLTGLKFRKVWEG